MKKIITLLLGVIAVTSVFAQSQADKQRAKDKVFGGTQNQGNYPSSYPNNYPTNYPNTYPNNYPNNSAQAEIDQINRDYDAKIYSVQNNPYLSPAEKDRQIRQLNQDRQRRIQEVYNRYGNGTYSNGKYKRKHKDHDDDDDRYENNGKGNNGKHLGWEKGKGNPHKGRGANWKD